MNGCLWVVALAAGVLIAYLIYLKRVQRPRANGLAPGVAVRFTRHALKRMELRGVTPAEVRAVLAGPARHERDSLKNSVRLEGDYEGRILKVWVVEPWPASAEVIVKSTAWHYYATLTISAKQVRRLIGHRGEAIRRLRDEFNAQISVESDGTVRISGRDKATTEHTLQRVRTVLDMP